jgi:ABC-2 type transport system ATP-binding protein
MSNNIIDIEHVWKRFVLRKDRADSVGQLLFRMLPVSRAQRSSPETFWALQDVSVAVEHGQSLGIIGNNGSGKSTLLKLLTRTMLPTKGTIRTSGRISALIELGAGFHPDFTGRENIFLNASILGFTRREIAGRLDEIIDFAELEAFIDTPVKYYSTGMNARLGFSVATAVDPEILIVDEILAVGDEGFQKKCMERIMSMKRTGVTILLVTHSLQFMETLMDRVLWLDRGIPRAQGKPSEVISAYRVHEFGSTGSPLAEFQPQKKA